MIRSGGRYRRAKDATDPVLVERTGHQVEPAAPSSAQIPAPAIAGAGAEQAQGDFSPAPASELPAAGRSAPKHRTTKRGQ